MGSFEMEKKKRWFLLFLKMGLETSMTGLPFTTPLATMPKGAQKGVGKSVANRLSDMLMHIFFRNGLRCLLYVSCMCEIWLLGKHLCRNVMENMWQKHIEGSCCSGGGNKEGGKQVVVAVFLFP